MNKKCVGCGSLLQSKYPDKDGYINEELINDAKYCKRCFKIKFWQIAMLEGLSYIIS